MSTLVRRALSRVAALAPFLALGCVAFVARLLPTLRGGGLRGLSGYDEGVYYAGAASLLHGRVPYADFVLLHPPGILIALTPFAALGRYTSDPLGLEAARLTFMVIGAVNAVLVAAVCRRFGTAAAVVGGTFYALWYPAASVEAHARLEPLGTTTVMVALLLLLRKAEPLARWQVILAGVALGLSLGFKIWAIAPVATICLWQLSTVGRARLWQLLLGLVLGAGALYGPFFALAPGAMVRMVILDQLRRHRMPLAPKHRITGILNLQPEVHQLPQTDARVLVATIGVLVAVAVVVSWRVPAARILVALLGVTGAVLLLAPTYFTYYSALTAPFLATVVGVAVGVAVQRLHGPAALIGLALAVAVAAVAFAPLSRPQNTPFPGAALARAAAAQGCVVADSPAALVEINAVSRDLARGCPLPVDFSGETYDYPGSGGARENVPRRANHRWQRLAIRYLTSGSATILVRVKAGDGFSSLTLKTLRAMPVLARVHGLTLYGRWPRTGKPLPS